MTSTRTAPRRRFTAGVLATVLLGIVALSACGSRRDAQEFVAANSGGAAAAVESGPGIVADPGATVVQVPAGGAGGAMTPGGPADSGGAQAGGQPQGAGPNPGAAKPATAAKGGTAPVAGNKCATSGSVITLGNISTQSGFLGELFRGLPEALQVWAKAANACGGLGGHPVRVISADDGADPATALTLAQRMVENDGVLAFIGLLNPLSVFGMDKYLERVGVPSIGGDSTEIPYFENPMFFPLAPFVSVIGAATADVAIKRGAKKLAVYYCTEVPNSCGPIAASKELQVGSPTVKALGGEVVISQKASVAAPSFTSQCIAAKRAGADAIVAILDGPSVGRLATNCHAQDYKPLIAGISLGLSANLVEYAAVQENNFVAPLNTFPWMDQSVPATKAFSDAVQKYFGRPLNGPSPAMGYVSGMLAQEATKAGLPANPTSADIVKAMYTIKNNNLGGLTAPLTFTTKLPREITSCYFQINISDGKYSAPVGNKCTPIGVKYTKSGA